MAYLAFNQTDGAPVAPYGGGGLATETAVAAPAHTLTTLEWAVVRIARRDGRQSVRPPNWKSVLARFLFGETNPRLADPRLEGLRRLAVLVWHDGLAVPPHERDAFLGAGFTSEQLLAISAYVSADRDRDRGTVPLL